MRRDARTDANHAEIREGLCRAGYAVFDVHHVPGLLDLQVLSKNGLIIVPMEIKSFEGKLTPKEEKYLKSWPGHIVRTLDEALEIMYKIDRIMIKYEC